MASILTQQESDKLAKGLGSLAHFPREIRNTIYKHMIAQGSVTIMRTSSLIKEELSATDLFEHGVCRLNLNFYDTATEELKPCFNPSQDIVNKIRNVAIRVDTRRNGSKAYTTPEIAILNKFTGAKVHRQTCAVSFVCWPSSGRKFQQDVLATVKAYTGFKTVEVAIECEQWPGRVWPEKLTNFSLEQIVEFDSLEQAFGTMCKVLTPKLGKAEGGEWHKGHFTALSFHPRGLKGGNV